MTKQKNAVNARNSRNNNIAMRAYVFFRQSDSREFLDMFLIALVEDEG